VSWLRPGLGYVPSGSAREGGGLGLVGGGGVMGKG